MMPRLLFLLAAFVLFAFQTQAQAYEPGLLVRSNGDTLRGEIENNFWLEQPKFIRFRRTPDGPEERLKPRQLRAALFTNGRYFRFERLLIDHAAETRLDRLPQGYHPDVRVDSLLAEVLLEGPSSLLRVVRLSATHYLFQRPGQPVLDISERKYLRATRAGKLVVVDGNNYRAQLGLYFGDCPAASQAVLSAPFSPEALVGIVQAFNQSCSTTQQPARSWLAQAAPKQRAAFVGGVLAGGRHLTLNSSSQSSPFVGAYGEALLPNRNIAVYGDLGLSIFKGQGSTVAYTVDTPVLINGTTVILAVPVYSSFSYRAALASARLGLRFYFRLPREQRWFASFSLEGNRVVVPAFSITAGPQATPQSDDLNGSTAPLLPEFGLGWRSRRITVSLDGIGLENNFAARLAVAYRLSRNPDSSRPAAQ